MRAYKNSVTNDAFFATSVCRKTTRLKPLLAVLTLATFGFAASYSDGALAPNKAGRVAPPTDLQNFSRLLPFCLAYRRAKNLHCDEF